MTRYIKYDHHGTVVFSSEDTVGAHRDFCLCYRCERFKPTSEPDNCSIAQSLFELCVNNHIVAPVFECPEFVQAEFVEVVKGA